MADLPVELVKAKPKTKAWLNKLRAVVKENAIVAGKNYTVNKHPGGTELVIDFEANLPAKKNSLRPYVLGNSLLGSDSDPREEPEPPNPDLSVARTDVFRFSDPPYRYPAAAGDPRTDGVDGYLTRFFTSTMISYVKVFQRSISVNVDGSIKAISAEVEDPIPL